MGSTKQCTNSKKDHETLMNFFVSLENDDDVQNLYSNAKFSD